jgi:superfamily I DNA and/or RNA helicase
VVETCRSELPKCSIEVNSVDAVQGREADLVILSTVRSNSDRRIGFLDSDKRANVALSRAKRGLVIVGDADFLAIADSPFQSVIGFIRQHPEFAVIEDLA